MNVPNELKQMIPITCHGVIKIEAKQKHAQNLNFAQYSLNNVISRLVNRMDAMLLQQSFNTTTVLRPFFRDHPGEPVPEENFWTLWCKGRLTEADTPTIRLGAWCVCLC